MCKSGLHDCQTGRKETPFMWYHAVWCVFFAPPSIWNGCGWGLIHMNSHLCFLQHSLISFVWLNFHQWKITLVSFLSLWYPVLSLMASVWWPGQCFQANFSHAVCNTPIASHHYQTTGIKTTTLFQTLEPHWQCLTAVSISFSCFTGFIYSFFPGQCTTWSFSITIICNFSPHFANSFLGVSYSNWHCF